MHQRRCPSSKDDTDSYRDLGHTHSVAVNVWADTLGDRQPPDNHAPCNVGL